MRVQRVLLAALLCSSTAATGCVSSGTWSAWHRADAELAAETQLDLEGDDGARSSAPRAFAFASCDDVARAAVVFHPGLAGPRHRAHAALAMARAEGALPAPSASVRVWGFPIGDPSLADRDGMYMLGVAQELPPAGSLDGRARARLEEARVALGELAEMRRDIASAAAHTCADWVSASLTYTRLLAWTRVLESMHDATQARYAAGAGSLADLARIERELATAERRARRSEGDAAEAMESLRARLGVEASASLGEAPDAAVSPELDADRVLAFALAHRGLLSAGRARIDAAAARADGAEARASVPTFMLGVMYMQVPQMRAGLGLDVGMTLPWLWSGEGDARDAARAEALAEEADVLGLERDLEVEVRTALAALDAVDATLSVLREREAPAAHHALDAVAAAYRGGEGTLLDWLDAARSVRELDLEEADLLGSALRAIADVTSAAGASVSELSTADVDLTRRTP